MLRRMRIETITEDKIFKTPIITLRAIDSEYCLPICIGSFEGQAIKTGLEGGQLLRPLPYDIIIDILNKLKVALEKVVIYDFKDNIFYAYIYLDNFNNEFIKIDARPSDAIALSVRCGCPIFIDDNVLEHKHNEIEKKAEILDKINPEDFNIS